MAFFESLKDGFHQNFTFSKIALLLFSTFTMLDRSPIFDSNSKKRFQTSTDKCGVKPPDDKTRSNNTRVLLSSKKIIKNLYQNNIDFYRII